MQERNPGIWIGVAVAVSVLVVAIGIPPKRNAPPPAVISTGPEATAASAVADKKALGLPTQPAAGTADSTASPQPPRTASAPRTTAEPRPGPTANPVNAGSVVQAIDDLHFSIRDYRTAVGENPVGTNAEITEALLGDNIKQVKIPIPPSTSVNAEGELCDAWGRPYFFHQLSGTKMEIRSAGSDGRMWTADDILR